MIERGPLPPEKPRAPLESRRSTGAGSGPPAEPRIGGLPNEARLGEALAQLERSLARTLPALESRVKALEFDATPKPEQAPPPGGPARPAADPTSASLSSRPTRPAVSEPPPAFKVDEPTEHLRRHLRLLQDSVERVRSDVEELQWRASRAEAAATLRASRSEPIERSLARTSEQQQEHQTRLGQLTEVTEELIRLQTLQRDSIVAHDREVGAIHDAIGALRKSAGKRHQAIEQALGAIEQQQAHGHREYLRDRRRAITASVASTLIALVALALVLVAR